MTNPTTNPTLLEQDCTGRWTTTTRFSLDQLVGATYQQRDFSLVTIETPEQAADVLARGFQVRHGAEWYSMVKRTKTPSEIEALRAIATRPFISTEQMCNVTTH